MNCEECLLFLAAICSVKYLLLKFFCIKREITRKNLLHVHKSEYELKKKIFLIKITPHRTG